MFRAIISPIPWSTDCVYRLWYNALTMMPAGNLDEAELLLYPVGCLYYCINDARAYKHQILHSNFQIKSRIKISSLPVCYIPWCQPLFIASTETSNFTLK